VTYFSPAVERISGYGPAEIVGRASFDIVVPEERERIGGVLSELLDRPGATRTVEFRIEHRDGSRRWVQSTATNLLEDPDIRAVVANFRDVTDRHRAVDELRESEERYRRIVEGTSEGVALMDSEGRITFANGRLADMLRYPREELLGRLASEFGPPESRRELEEKLARGMRGESGAHERPFLRRDGSSVWLELDVSPLFDANGNAEGALGLFRDVSSRRRAEEMRNRLAAIVESSDDAIIGLDLDGTVTSWNRGAERLYQREAEAMIGQPVAVLTPPDLRGEQGELLARIRDGERVLHRETRRLRADGSTVEVALTIWPIHDSSGRIAGISKIARNLTERRKAEAAVRRTEEQLRQAQKMEAVGSLAGGVAHDFNNLLSVILSYATMLSDSLTPGDPMRTDLEEIVKAGSRATDLTRQLLAFSRQQLLQPRVVDLNTIVANMQGMLRRVLGEHIELTMLMAQSLGKIFADPGQIEQVVMNLIVNARDAMPMGGKLTIETANAELDAEYAASHHGVTPGHYVMLAVTDGGIGMEPAVKARIFEPFFTTKGVGKGTGLGLSTVLGIVQQTGGHVWVYSEPGSGTTFRVYLPRTDRTAEQAPMPARTAEAIRGAETVLLVEDEEQVRRTMQLILRRHGYNVLEAENGGDALLLCEQYPATIHLLLTDVVMPRMNGRHLAERLATVRPHMKVLYVSGYTENAIVRHGILDAGIQYLSKPITPDALLRRVREVLDGSGSRRPSRP
jgi:PAS domain S-box-containing protein